jgi:hypothetical protein
MREKGNFNSGIMRWLLLWQQVTFEMKYVKGSENLSDYFYRVDMSDPENRSFDYNFTKTCLHEKDIALNVIHVSNSQLEKSKEICKFPFHGLKDYVQVLTTILPRLIFMRKILHSMLSMSLTAS